MHKTRLMLSMLMVMLIALTAIGTASAQDTETVDCPSDTFIDVSTYEQTQEYPNPEVTVSCEDDMMVIESNGIPNFEFVEITPSALSAQNYTWTIPLNPEIAEEPTGVPLLNLVAVAVNGLPIFGPTEAPNQNYSDPFLDQLLDYCNGHTAPQGDYHYHARPECLFEDMEGNTSLVIGWALDGFPILAPYVCTDEACSEVIEVQSSYERTQQDESNAWIAHEYVEGSGDLDICNGMTLADGSYAYFATDTFPYFVGCYIGTPLFEGNNNNADLAPVFGDTDYDWTAASNAGPGGGGQGGPPPGGDGGQGGPPPGGDGGQGGPPPGGDGGQGGPPPGGNGG